MFQLALEINQKYDTMFIMAITLLRPLAAPLASLIFLMMASGLFNTFVSIRLEIESFDNQSIGTIVSMLYAGILAGSVKVQNFIQRVGHIRALISFALVSAIVILAQSLWIQAWYWGFLRFIGGLCMAGIFVAIESWLLLLSTPATRGVVLSIYLGVFYGAMSLGQFLIHLANPMSSTFFYLAAALCLLSIFPISFCRSSEPKIEDTTKLSLIQLMRMSPLGFMGGIISGMVLAAIYGLVPVFARARGLAVGDIGNLMAAIIFGGLSLQWPLGRLADRTNRKTVLNLVSFAAAFASILLALAAEVPFPFLLVLAWLFGGFAFTIYPLSMAYTCENMQESQIVAATGGFVLSYSIGAVAGPLAAPIAMQLFGHIGLFYFLAAISLSLGLCGILPLKTVKKITPK